MLVDERNHLGGEIINDFFLDDKAYKWYKKSCKEINEYIKDGKRFHLLLSTTAFAWHNDNFIELLQNF